MNVHLEAVSLAQSTDTKTAIEQAALRLFFERHHHLRRVTRRMGNPYLAFRNVISRAMMRRQIPRQDLDLAASLVIGALIQVIDTRILGRISSNLPEQADRVAGALVGLLRA